MMKGLSGNDKFSQYMPMISMIYTNILYGNIIFRQPHDIRITPKLFFFTLRNSL